MSSPRFSVIVPAYNAARTVRAAIRSALSQTCADFELIVVDDGSTDDTGRRVEECADPRIKLIRERNAGPSAARNAGIAMARGRYLTMLDSDNMLLPTYLETMGGALDAEPAAGLAYTDAWGLDLAAGRLRRATVMSLANPPIPPPHSASEFLIELVQRNFVFTSVTLPRWVIEEVGPYREDLRAAEDHELWLRVLAAGHRAVRPPGRLAIAGSRSDSLSNDERLMYSGARDVYRIVCEEYDVPEAVRAIARRRLGEVERGLIALDRWAPLDGAWRVARRHLGRARRAVLGARYWCPDPPAEVAATVWPAP